MRLFIGRIINHDLGRAWEQALRAALQIMRLQKFGRRMLFQAGARGTTGPS